MTATRSARPASTWWSRKRLKFRRRASLTAVQYVGRAGPNPTAEGSVGPLGGGGPAALGGGGQAAEPVGQGGVDELVERLAAGRRRLPDELEHVVGQQQGDLLARHQVAPGSVTKSMSCSTARTNGVSRSSQVETTFSSLRHRMPGSATPKEAQTPSFQGIPRGTCGQATMPAAAGRTACQTST